MSLNSEEKNEAADGGDPGDPSEGVLVSADPHTNTIHVFVLVFVILYNIFGFFFFLGHIFG